MSIDLLSISIGIPKAFTNFEIQQYLTKFTQRVTMSLVFTDSAIRSSYVLWHSIISSPNLDNFERGAKKSPSIERSRIVAGTNDAG